MHLQQALRVPLAQTASSGCNVPPKSITGGSFVLKHLVTRGEFTIGDTSPSNPTCPTLAELKHCSKDVCTVSDSSLPKSARIDKEGLSCSIFCPTKDVLVALELVWRIVRATGFFSTSFLQLLFFVLNLNVSMFPSGGFISSVHVCL